MATVRITGNWRNINETEWLGAPVLDDQGRIERSLEIPLAVYEKIETAIAAGHLEGTVRVGGSTFSWFLDRARPTPKMPPKPQARSGR